MSFKFKKFVKGIRVFRIYLHCCNLFLPAGKNAYAMSVLRQVELKLDGRDIMERRYLRPFETGNRYPVNYVLTASPFVLPSGKLALQSKWIIYLNKLLVLTIFAACMKVGRHGFKLMKFLDCSINSK